VLQLLCEQLVQKWDAQARAHSTVDAGTVVVYAVDKPALLAERAQLKCIKQFTHLARVACKPRLDLHGVLVCVLSPRTVLRDVDINVGDDS
jgi:hypothetical protein